MNECIECRYYVEKVTAEQATVENPQCGDCHGMPPHVLLVPVMVQPRGKVMVDQQQQQMTMRFQSVRGVVLHNAQACAVFAAKALQ